VQCFELLGVIKAIFERFTLAVSWNLTPHVRVFRYKYFEGTCCFHLQS